MGAVYQAHDQVLDIDVALKVIGPTPANSSNALDLEQRFKRELILARQVSHRNVVRIHDLGDVDGTTYISMSYIEGADLAAIMKRDGRFPVDRDVAIAKDIS